MGTLEVIKKNESMRKIFGKREIVIIEKQLLGIALKPSEKTRLSRDIRKKFEAVSLLAPFVQEFKLKHGAVIKEMVKEAEEAILKSKYFSRIKKIVLFGSAVENTLTFRSDIDIAVYFDEITEKEALRFRLDILREVNEKIDIQVYNVLPDKIKKQIDKGKILYERQNKRQN